jgi:hypothetical protein
MSNVIIAGQDAASDRTTGDDTITALHDAIGVISSVCDYAQELDAQGFNAADAWLGHVLAQMPPGLWTDSAALTAWDMLRKYRGQLAAAGISYDQLPRPAGAGELETGRREPASVPASTPGSGGNISTGRPIPTSAATATASRSPWRSPTTRTWSPHAAGSRAAATTARPRSTSSRSPACPP